MFQFKKILFCLDISHPDGEAFDHAIQMAERNQGVLSILYVFPSYGLPLVSTFFSDGTHKKAMEEARQEIEKLCNEKSLRA